MKKALIFSGVKWDSPWQRHHIITQTLIQKNYSVDFIEGIISSKLSLEKLKNRFIQRKIKLSSENPRPKNLNIITAPSLPYLKLTENIYKRKIKSNLKNEYDLIITYIPRKEIIDIIKEVKCKKYIYDCVRDFQNWPGIDNNIIQSEKFLINYSDEIWCDSYWLEKRISSQTTKLIKRIPPTIPDQILHQIKKEHFIPRTKKIKDILYFGTISEHVDLNVFEHLNSLGYNIIFIGKNEIEIPNFIKRIGYISNQNELFEKIKKVCDLIIIPYKGKMDGVIPSKLNISLASGKPIIISEFFDSKLMSKDELLKEAIFTYKDKQDLKKLITHIENQDLYNRFEKIKIYLKENTESKFKELFF